MVEVDFRTVTEVTGRGRQAAQADKPAIRREQRARPGQHVPPADIRHVKAGQVHGRARAGLRLFHGNAVALQRSGLARQPCRQHGHGIAHPERAGEQRARGHRAMPLDGERAIHGQAHEIAPAAGRQRLFAGDDVLAQGVDAFPGQRGNRKARRVFQKRALDEGGHIFPDQFKEFGVGRVRFGDGHKPVPDAEQGADFEMLARLGHHPLVRRNDEHDEIDS